MKNLGIISISLTWLGLIFLIKAWPGNTSMSFSQHAAQNKAAQMYYLLLFLVTLPLFYLFMIDWFAPHFKMGLLFKLLVTICSGCMLVAAVTPETTGRKIVIHRYAAFTMSYCFLPITLLIVLSKSVSTPARIFGTVVVLYMLYGVYLLTKYKRRHPKMLYFQASYIAVFHLTILAATYLR